MDNLWNKDVEKDFFVKSLEFATPEQLFYVTNDGRYLAYWPKNYKGRKTTLQSRNSLIGNFTEKWTTDLIQNIIGKNGLFAVQGGICPEIALPRNSPGDVIISNTKGIYQRAEDIKMIIEVKMSVVWNWMYSEESNDIRLDCIGDYKSHKGNPGLLRSDSMLKAIGKSINIRVSSPRASRIPIIVLGNTPITNNYYSKVDHLKGAGIIQGFWSINPEPLEKNDKNIKATDQKGYVKLNSGSELREMLNDCISGDINFFSSMKSKKDLGIIIEMADRKATYEEKAAEFLRLLRG